MSQITFDYDAKEGLGDGFLTPVYFDKHVLVKYLYDPRISVEFASETYGTVYWPGGYIAFGINRQGSVIAWLGDLKDLQQPEQQHWRSENIPPQHDMQSEFYDAQINAEFTDYPIGIQAINALDRWNATFAGRYGVSLYKPKSFDDRLEAVRRYRRIIIQSEDDFVRFISELNEIVNESANTDEIRKLLTSKGVGHDKGLRGNKLLELVYVNLLGDNKNIIEPFFMLYDLRLWADHSMGNSKLEDVTARLGISDSHDFEGVLTTLLERLRDSATELQEKLGEP